MCGIIGYIGPEGRRAGPHRRAAAARVPRLRLGRRRGRRTTARSTLRRSAGKLSNLENVIAAEPLTGDYGLGHTRWATHGRPTEENAHPHRDCTGRIVVVHNGIIENYLELKRELQRAGPQVRHRNRHRGRRAPGRAARWKDDGLENAVRRALMRMRGLFALVLISADDPEKIVAVRNGPPIVVGLGDGEYFVASDIPAILSHTRDVVFLDDEEMAVVTRDGRRVHRLRRPAGLARRRSASPGIRSWRRRPATSTSCSRRSSSSRRPCAKPMLGRVSHETGQVFLDEMTITDAELQRGRQGDAARVRHVVARGAGRQVHDRGAGASCRSKSTTAPSTATAIRSSTTTRWRSSSRSRARPPTRWPRCAKPKRKGARSLAICNVVGSMATREADGTIYTHAGPEIGVASTKAFTTQLVALYLLALQLGAGARHAVAAKRRKPHIDALLQLPQLLEQTLKIAPADRGDRRAVPQPRRLPVPRPRHQLPDRARRRAEAEGNLLHPRRRLSGRRDEARADRAHRRAACRSSRIAPHDHVFEKMLGNIQEAKARGGSVIALTTAGDDKLAAMLDPSSDFIIAVPRRARAADADRDVVPLQLLAVPHRRPPRLRRRSAAESREERHGRIESRRSRGFGRTEHNLLLLLESLASCSSLDMHFLDITQSRTARSCSAHRRPAADPRRRRLGEDARHRASHRLSRRRRPRQAATRCWRSPSPTRPREEMRDARRGAARHRLPPACGCRRSTRCARGCCAARRRTSACRATSSSTIRPISRPSSSRC